MKVEVLNDSIVIFRADFNSIRIYWLMKGSFLFECIELTVMYREEGDN